MKPCAAYYSGTMGTEVMNDTLQAWVNDMTGGMLTDQAGGTWLSEGTLLAIVTTIYYMISWLVSFNEEKTASGIFHAAGGDVICQFMNRTGEMNYVDGDGYSAVYLPTGDGEISDGGMWLILPDENLSVDELLETFDIADLIGDATSCAARNTEILECGESAMVTLSVPKFDVSSDMELSESMKALGVTDVFDKELADFSPLQGDGVSSVDGAIYLGQMQHAARVSIDENGIEAAAYTVEVVSGDSIPELRVEFVLDRPFLFVITSGNAELFAGVVNQP